MIKKIVALASAASLLCAGMAFAAGSSSTKGGLGFHVIGSPFDALLAGSGFTGTASPTLGVRQWFSDKVGGDLAVGFSSLKFEPGGGGSETFSGWTIDVGVPVSLKSWDKVNFLFRPGVGFGSLKDDPSVGTSTTLTTLAISGELEVEWMVADNVSVSASQGFSYNTLHDDANPEDKFTAFGTTGSNFTQLGFHVYLW